MISDQGVCASFAMPEGQVFPCHEVRLPGGEVIALDIGPHERFPIGSMLYFQRVTHAAPHPLFDHDRYDFYAHRRPGG
ncbi:hypothetical protein A8B78_19635 [Jannaschia sp. EhC01]|nr:hypothetical protein A8B78_19635 [Jannaschia sp. EhC01]